MIPYDDLVAALSAWRARQGLPVSTMGGNVVAAPSPGSGPTPSPGSGPQAKAGSGPTRGAPPAPPSARTAAVPPPLDEALDVDDAAMLEEQYETEGSDFAMAFGADVQTDGEATSIGGAPERPTDSEISSRGRSGGGGGRNNDDW